MSETNCKGAESTEIQTDKTLYLDITNKVSKDSTALMQPMLE